MCVREKKMLRTGNEDVMSSPFFWIFFFIFSALQSHKFLVSCIIERLVREDQSRRREGKKQNATKKLKVEREKEIISITLIIIGALASLL